MKYIKNPNTKCACSNPKHHAIWILNVKGIARSLESVLKTGDIEKLTKDAYDFVMNMSGFIAHFNHGGFMAHYNNVNDLLNALKNSSDTNQAERYVNDSYFANNEQSQYYAQKTELLLIIKSLCDKYENATKQQEDDTVREKMNLLIEMTARAEKDPLFAKNLLRELSLI